MATIDVATAPVASPAQPSLGGEVVISAQVARNGSSGRLRAGFKRGEEQLGTPIDIADAASGVTYLVQHLVKPFDQDDVGTYTLWTSDGDGQADLDDRASVDIQTAAESEDNEEEDRGSLDLRDLVWDPEFAGATGAMAGIVLIVIGIICTVAASRFIGTTPTSDDVGSLVIVVGIFLGAAMVIAGSWIAVLEMRGRAPRDPGEGRRWASASGTGLKEAIEAITGMIKAIGKLRTPMALFVTGAVLIGAMALFADRMNADQRESGTPTPTTTIGD